MTNSEINDELASELMGWKRDTTDRCGWPNGDYYPPSRISEEIELIRGTTEDSVKTTSWSATKDRNDLAMCLRRIEKLNLTSHLIRALGLSSWGLLTVDPRTVCEALIKLIRSRKGANPPQS